MVQQIFGNKFSILFAQWQFSSCSSCCLRPSWNLPRLFVICISYSGVSVLEWWIKPARGTRVATYQFSTWGLDCVFSLLIHCNIDSSSCAQGVGVRTAEPEVCLCRMVVALVSKGSVFTRPFSQSSSSHFHTFCEYRTCQTRICHIVYVVFAICHMLGTKCVTTIIWVSY